MESKKESIVIYYKKLEQLRNIIQAFKDSGIDVILESCERCISNVDDCILDTLNEFRPNTVLIDNDMSNNGLTLYKLIRDEGTINNIPVIFTGIPNEDMKMEALKLGAIDYLSKPFSEEELLIKCKNLVNLSRKFISNNIYDYQTGLYTKRFGDELGKKVLKAVREDNNDFVVLAVDIDNMALINDTIGKANGDQLLAGCIEIFKGFMGAKDLLYRYSGQRFMMILTGKDVREVYETSKLMLEKVIELKNSFEIEVSFTGGIAAANQESEDYETIVGDAVNTLKLAKREGKSKVYIHSESLKPARRKSILILDEDKVMLTILGSRYKNKGYQIFTSENEESMEEILRENIIDIVITDLLMAGTTGSELICKIRKHDKNIKIIILSSQKNEGFMEMALSSGADDYISKPFSPVELDLRIRRLLE